MDEAAKARRKLLARRVRRGALLLAAFVVGWYCVVRIASPWTIVKSITLGQGDPASSGESSRTLRVGCYNIAHGRGGRLGARNWEGGDTAAKLERLRKIGRLLEDAELDIVVLNEVDFSSFWSGHIDQARVIVGESGHPFLVEQRNIDAGVPFCSARYGNAVLSRYPIVETQLLDYPNVSKLAEVFVGGIKEGVVCTVQLSDGSLVSVVAVHLSHTSEAVRVASARMIVDVQHESTTPLIALGDFNATPRGYPEHETDDAGDNAIEVMSASGQLTTLPTGLPADPRDFTFPSEDPDQVIDWVFVSRHWRLTEKRVLSSDLSDHLPVVATLTRDGDN